MSKLFITHKISLIFTTLLLCANQVAGQCNPPIVVFDTVVSCGDYTWPNNGITYPYSNHIVSDTIFNGAANGCDSTVQLYLDVYHDVTTFDAVYTNSSYTWINGVTYTSSNNSASVTFTSAAGCDSTVFLNLTIAPIQDTVFIDTNICAGDSIEVNDKYYDSTGIYYDSVIIVTTAPKTINYGNTIAVSPSTNPGYGWGRPSLYYDYNSDGASVPYGGGQYSLIRLDAPFWRGNGNVSNSIVNQIGVWSSGVPNGQWYGSTFTVNIPESKTYYVMLVGDNSFRFSLDGVVKITSDPNQIIIAEPRNPPTTVTFTWLHIYPFYLTQGCHTITLEGKNDSGPGMFGGAILSNTDLEIYNATQNSDLNYLFSTANVTTFYSSDPPTFSCPAGMSPMGPGMCNQCIKIEGNYFKIDLTVDTLISENYTDTICSGDTYTLYGNTYNTSGIYQDTLQNTYGCDSLAYTLDLTVISNINVNAGNDTTVCQGSSMTLAAQNPDNATLTWSDGITDGVAFTPNNTNTYTVTANIGTCSATDSLIVSVINNITVNAGTDTSICQGENITLLAQNPSGATISWNNGVTDGVAFSPSSTNSYIVTASSGSCSATDTVVVSILSNISVYAGNDTSICQGASIILTAQNPNNGIIAWNNGITDGVSFVPTTTDEYIVSSSKGSCSATDTVEVTVVSNINISAGNDTSICQGASIMLSAINPGNATISWNNGITDGVAFVPANTTTYTVSASNGVCSGFDSVEVTVLSNPQPSFVGENLKGCAPLEVVFVRGGTPVAQNSVCAWNFGDGQSTNDCSDTVYHTYTNSGLYSITLNITNQNGCEGNFAINDYVEVSSSPIADFIISSQNADILNPTVQFVNQSSDATSYQWIFEDGEQSAATNVEHTFPNDEAGVYEVALIASNGNNICNDTIEKTIRIKGKVIYYVPNTFTPDNIGFNQVFKPVFTSGFDPYDYVLFIYNRWGELLFESHNAKIGWDGTYGGKVVEDGVYVWKISFKEPKIMSDKRHIIKGHVNLLK